MPRPWPTALLLLSLAACGLALPPAGAPERAPDLWLRGVTIRSYRGSSEVARSRAPAMTVDRGSGVATLVDAGLWLAGPQLVLTAPLATGHLGEGWLQGSGGVTLTGQDGLWARAPTARFDSPPGAQGVVSGPGPVELRTRGVRLSAGAFQVDVDSQRATFESPRTQAETPR